MTPVPTHAPVVVVGAGQAGLSVSYYLARLGLDPGVDFVVFDRGPGTGGAWQLRWEALRIGSAHRINDLPGMDELGLSFENAGRALPAKEVVADYYRQYEEHFGLRVHRPTSVRSVFNRGSELIVGYDSRQPSGSTRANSARMSSSTPPEPGAHRSCPGTRAGTASPGRQLHTTDYTDAADFAGQSVIVVGGGTSAIGFLMELENVATELLWVTRSPTEFRDEGELNLEARVKAVALQDEAARAGRALPSIVSGTGVPVTRRIHAAMERGLLIPRPMFTAIEPLGVRFADGSFHAADAILWSTGFRPELRHLAPLKLREKAGGVTVGSGASWKDPRIFFAGYGPQASTIGANRAGRQIARQVVAQLSNL